MQASNLLGEDFEKKPYGKREWACHFNTLHALDNIYIYIIIEAKRKLNQSFGEMKKTLFTQKTKEILLKIYPKLNSHPFNIDIIWLDLVEHLNHDLYVSEVAKVLNKFLKLDPSDKTISTVMHALDSGNIFGNFWKHVECLPKTNILKISDKVSQ